MEAVSSKEFASHPKKYFDEALQEDVLIRRGANVFRLVYDGGADAAGYNEILKPDDDFRRALTGEEFREKLIPILERIDRKFADKCK